jgi:4-carboxymuconolactone decarboxylase
VTELDPVAVATYCEMMAADPPSGLTDNQREGFNDKYGHLWSSPVLGRRERRLLTLTFVAYRVAPEPIKAHVYGALKTGDLSVEELLEVVLHFAVYCGWPKASNLEMHVRQAWAQVQQEAGDDPQPLPSRSNDELGLNDWEGRLRRGEREFEEVNLLKAPPRDTPYQHSGILSYVFGHVWQRPGLSRRDRRFVTIASVGLCEAPIPISSHVGSAVRSGDLSGEEMAEAIRHFEAYAGPALAEPLRAAAA